MRADHGLGAKKKGKKKVELTDAEKQKLLDAATEAVEAEAEAEGAATDALAEEAPARAEVSGGGNAAVSEET